MSFIKNYYMEIKEELNGFLEHFKGDFNDLMENIIDLEKKFEKRIVDLFPDLAYACPEFRVAVEKVFEQFAGVHHISPYHSHEYVGAVLEENVEDYVQTSDNPEPTEVRRFRGRNE